MSETSGISKAAAERPRSIRSLSQTVYSPWDFQVVATAVRFGIADRLADGPRTTSRLAAEVGAEAEIFESFLRACAVLGLVERNDQDEYALTALGNALCTGASALRSMTMMNMGEGMWLRMNRLHETVRTGKPVLDDNGENLYEHYARAPEEGSWHSAAMAELSVDAGNSLAAHYDFAGCSTIVDVGGGLGVLLSRVLTAADRAKGIVFDLPGVVARGREGMAGSAVEDRISFCAGSFFTDAPPPGDLYLVKNVLCDWSDDDAGAILANCYRAAPSGSRLAVIDWVRSPEPTPSPLDLLTLCVQVTTGGRVRTETEFATLIERAGYRFERSLRIPSGGVLEPSGVAPRPWHVLEAVHP